MRTLALLLLLMGGGLALGARATRDPVTSRGEWCGCRAGPTGCSRPCAGCCGGSEAVCFSGMDPTGCHR